MWRYWRVFTSPWPYLVAVQTKMRCAVVLAVLVAAAMAAPHRSHHVEAPEMTFDQFKATFGKAYASEAEESVRAAVFAQNLEFIAQHNADKSKTYTVGINEFADLTSCVSLFCCVLFVFFLFFCQG